MSSIDEEWGEINSLSRGKDNTRQPSIGINGGNRVKQKRKEKKTNHTEIKWQSQSQKLASFVALEELSSFSSSALVSSKLSVTAPSSSSSSSCSSCFGGKSSDFSFGSSTWLRNLRFSLISSICATLREFLIK